MKAYQILMFLLIFNSFVWVVDGGLHIYDLDYSGLDPSETSESTEGFFGILTSGSTIAALAVAIAGGALVGGMLRIQKASQGVVYGAFTAVFWFSYLQAMTILWNISESVPGAGIILLTVMTAVVGYVFVVGLFQMVTGGWKSYV